LVFALTKVLRLGSVEAEKEQGRGGRSLLSLASEVAAAYVSNNSARSEDIPDLIAQIYRTLSCLSEGRTVGGLGTALRPAVPIERSVTQDYIVCLEDGKKLKMLKRHLRATYNLTPELYRERWRLPADYPMVAPSYARKRSHLAKANGLGQSSVSRFSRAV
jgi:predicted transcriptional regulator